MAGGVNAIGNLLGKVDANGALLVAISGAAGPVDSLAFSGGSSINGATASTLKLRATGSTDILTLTSTAVTSTVPVLGPDGTAANPSFRVTSEATGTYLLGAGVLATSIATTPTSMISATDLRLISTVLLGWSSSGSLASSDTIIGRGGVATVQFGVNAAGVTDQMLKGPDRITSDGVGGNLTIAGGRNRGASAGGSVIIQTAPAAGAGVTGTLAAALTIDSTKTATFTGTVVLSTLATALQLSSTGLLNWDTRAVMTSPADGKLIVRNQGNTTGVTLDTTTDSTLKLFARDGSSAASLVLPAGSNALAPLVITNGTNLTTATANAVENDGVAFYTTNDTTNGRRVSDAWNFFELTGDGTGITTIADFFGATGSGIPLVANGRYKIEWHCVFTQATAGTATWTIVTATTALAVLDAWYMGTNIAGGGTVGAPQTAGVNTTASSSTALPVTGTEATGVTHQFDINAVVTAGNGASNTRLRLTMGAGTATPKAGSYIRVTRLPAANTGTFAT